MTIRLTTARLLLVAADETLLRAERDAPERWAAMLGAIVPKGWPPGEYDRGALEFFLERLHAEGHAAVGWYLWYAVGRAEPGRPATMIGAGGYFGPPSGDGTVEIGFSIVAAEQGRGYATELAAALVARALADARVRIVIAHTTPANTASCRVLAKCGFHPAGTNVQTGASRFEIRRCHQ